MEKLIEIKEALEQEVYEKLDCLEQVNTKEMGEVIDMIKDLAQALYYCSMTKKEEASS